MKAYSEYKNSEIEWVKQIPSDWEICKLKYTALGKGQCFIDGDWIESKDISTDGIRYLTSGNVGPLKYKEQGNGYITEDTFRKLECKDVYKGDILISRLNEPISRACIVPNLNSRIVTCVDNVIYRPDCSRFNKKYIVYVLNCTPYTENANLSARGVTMHRVSRTMLGNFYIPVPSIAEQEAIASFLDAKTKPIDDIIAKREKQIELLEEMKSAIISRAVTKGLNPGAKMKDSGIEWIGEIPEGWEMCKLKYILKSEKYNIKTGPFGTQLKGNDLREEGDVPVYNQRNVIDNQFHSPSVFVTLDKANELAGFHTKPNDVLITSRGTIGKAAILPNGAKEGILHPCLIALRINQDLVNLKYLLYYINGFEGFAINVFLESNATTIEVIYTDTLKNIFVTLPQLEEQEAIASYLDSETSKIDTRIAKRRKQIELLQEYKQALITAAVTGKIDVREYNS